MSLRGHHRSLAEPNNLTPWSLECLLLRLLVHWYSSYIATWEPYIAWDASKSHVEIIVRCRERRTQEAPHTTGQCSWGKAQKASMLSLMWDSSSRAQIFTKKLGIRVAYGLRFALSWNVLYNDWCRWLCILMWSFGYKKLSKGCRKGHVGSPWPKKERNMVGLGCVSMWATCPSHCSGNKDKLVQM